MPGDDPNNGMQRASENCIRNWKNFCCVPIPPSRLHLRSHLRAPEQPLPTTTPLIRTTNGNVNPVAKVASRKASKTMISTTAAAQSMSKPTMILSPQLSGNSITSRGRNRLAQTSPSSSRNIDDKSVNLEEKVEDKLQDLKSIQEDLKSSKGDKFQNIKGSESTEANISSDKSEQETHVPPPPQQSSVPSDLLD